MDLGLHTIPFAISELRVGASDDTAASNESAISPDRCGPNHGDTAFTVPMFDEFMKRAIPGDSWR
jgi:hypothetical protein